MQSTANFPSVTREPGASPEVAPPVWHEDYVNTLRGYQSKLSC